ncbi:MAG TPA: MFS transporter [Rhizomicrobium sp.]|nr:MFS transporter [Rhizomicrobium sp.]
MSETTAARRSFSQRFGDSFRPYTQRRTLIMLALGFSSGLPFNLIGNTFGYWLRDEGTSLAAIGFISWVGTTYFLKFLWAPLIDRTHAPIFGPLGNRRSWMALSQVLVGLALIAMAFVSLKFGLVALGAVALVVAFASATQDIVIDAWRIESAENADDLGLLTSAYSIGYRTALLGTEAIILPIAQRIGWPASYVVYGLLMVVGFMACLMAREPRAAEALEHKQAEAPLTTRRGLYDAIVGPFVVFFRTYGSLSLVILVAISLFQLPNYLMGPMANPLYHDIGLTKDAVGAVRGTFGLAAIFIGVAAGGFACLRLGQMHAVILGGIIQGLSIAAYALLPIYGANFGIFAFVMAFNNFGVAFAGVALVAYMSSLTTAGYTATQYALLSSAFAFVGKLLKGLSGVMVQAFVPVYGLMKAYAIFFVVSGTIALPSIVLFAMLSGRRKPTPAAQTQPL